MSRRDRATAAVVVAACAAAGVARAEGDALEGDLSAEYRVRTPYVNRFELSGTTKLRLSAALASREIRNPRATIRLL